MIITLKGATFTHKLDLNSWMIISDLVGVTSSNTVTKVTKGDTYTTTFTINTGCTLTEENVSVVCNGVTKTLTWDKLTEGGKATLSFAPDATVYITIRATGANSGGGEVVEPDTPVTPTSYTFTINPDPISATVTLSATGYSTVSGTGSQSITVVNGTTVNWRVEASGYTTRTGNWTINGGNKTENITLTATSGGENNVVFDFDFTTSTLANYANQGIFTVPDTSTIDAITYDSTKGANLNDNLPYGLTLTNPIDASRAWALEFTATMVTPTVLVGNRRAFITGGSDLAPFVVINFSGTGVASQGFQISNGAHKWVGTGKLIYDQEVTYKIVHDGASNIVVYQNGVEFGTTTCDFTGKTFGTILGVIKGKSSAYIWKDVESGKKSYLKKLKFSYN